MSERKRQAASVMRWCRALPAVVAGLGLLMRPAGGQSTSFNVDVSADAGDLRFRMDDTWSVLFSLENVYYDEHLNCTPKQAFRVTDVNGDPLEPFAIPTMDPENYVLDLSYIKTKQGLKPYFRGNELKDSTLRAWRMDYHKGGVDNPVYTTVMSGIAIPIAPSTYMLRVDLGLHWEIEGDAINRLQQGFNTHIALAVADFQSFTLALDADEKSGSLTADVKTSTTSTSTSTSTTTERVDATTATVATTTVAVASTTKDNSENREPVTTTALDTTRQNKIPPTTTTEEEQNRYEDCSQFLNNGNHHQGKKKKKSKHNHEYNDCLLRTGQQSRLPGEDSKKGKGKKGKDGGDAQKREGKDGKSPKLPGGGAQMREGNSTGGKGKKEVGAAMQKTAKPGKVRRSGLVGGIAFALVSMTMYGVLVQRRTAAEAKAAKGAPADVPEPVAAPLSLRAFGTFDVDINDAVNSMRVPPSPAGSVRSSSRSPSRSPPRENERFVNERSALNVPIH